MNEVILKATHDGTLQIGNALLFCAVLEDGSRVLTQAGFFEAIGRNKSGGSPQGQVASNLPPFLTAKNLKLFISKELEEAAVPVIFKPLRGGGNRGKALGYKAELLPAVCNVFLAAREVGALLPNQEHIAKQCEILVRGLATVGIVALVDEVTGYQRDRSKNELNRILEAYIAKELLPWTKMFPDDFYKELFRLKNWQYNPFSVKRPILVGKLTNKIVYEKLPPGILEELKTRNPRNEYGKLKYHYHRLLTSDVGHPHLERHLTSVTTLMRVSTNWEGFVTLLEKAFPSTDYIDTSSFPAMEEYLDDGEHDN